MTHVPPGLPHARHVIPCVTTQVIYSARFVAFTWSSTFVGRIFLKRTERVLDETRRYSCAIQRSSVDIWSRITRLEVTLTGFHIGMCATNAFSDAVFGINKRHSSFRPSPKTRVPQKYVRTTISESGSERNVDVAGASYRAVKSGK